MMIHPRREAPRVVGPISAGRAADLLRNLGFLVLGSLPDRSGDAHLLVALRRRPTRRHYDPELIRYWRTTPEGRGSVAELSASDTVPFRGPFSWGRIELLDRLGVVNEFVTIGGELTVEAQENAHIAIFSSPGPIYRMGGHSQRVDPAAPELGAFFARMMVAIDFEPGVEEAISLATPLERYSAFVAYEDDRHRASTELREEEPRLATILAEEATRLATSESAAWAAGLHLLELMDLGPVHPGGPAESRPAPPG
jgi:hypothetical protein